MTEMRKNILQFIYDYEQSEGSPCIIKSDGSDFNFDSHTLASNILYLESKKYIQKQHSAVLGEMHLSLTEKGEQFVENGFESPREPSQTVFNIGSAQNSIVGTQENATLTNGYSIDDITKLIERHNSDDEELLKEMVSVLEKAVSNQEPVKKGLLSKFVGVFQRNEWITAPIASFIFEKFFLR